ncbi:DmsC/YnfH family molybdoenzyme membrane anchor subunit [Nitrosophilus alvini]|uniref:DmsC/YnfH family molybdoenzyme membrane anchor subunit n=1 Tax=Nitrosophilus alvini TaxID=2714855 RepID=UPI001F2B4BD2|nr:DmsC/YnfH family molybdoenzyme membrane anchor subunit [Nitrosophilus alvini]
MDENISAVESFIDYKAATGMQCGNYSIDLPELKEGEQYRFHFDATKCIGCHCCEVACNEINNNPVDVKYRRVGELEGGIFPDASWLFISMGCNHCIDPWCLKGCPTKSYIKIDNGIVIHDDEACIGCQYCTWNCPYGVPVYNKERHIVTKCHMCYEKIEAKETPACVQACPEGAIEIEVVNKEEWMKNSIDKEGNAPGLVDARVTMSTTRYTLPQNLPPKMHPVDEGQIKPSHPEIPLVFMTVLTQISLFGFLALFLGDLFASFSSALPAPDFWVAIAVLIPAAAGLPLSALHLGRPFKALSAMKNIKTSWLSREAAALGAFVSGMTITALLYFFNIDGFARIATEALTAAVGIYGIFSQAMIYMIEARPSWNRKTTIYKFFGTGFAGILLVAAVAIAQNRIDIANSLIALALLLGALQIYLFFESKRFYEMLNPDHRYFYQLDKTKKLLFERFGRLYKIRQITLITAAAALPLLVSLFLSSHNTVLAFFLAVLAFVTALVSELIGRLLFYTTAVPLQLPGNFFAGAQRG